MSNKARDAALSAVAKLMERIPDSDEYITNDWLMEAAGAEEPPEGSTRKDFEKFSLYWMQVREHFVTFTIERTGRMLATQHGVGFRLLAPGDSVPYIEDVAITKVKRTLGKAVTRMQSVRPDSLSIDENARRTRSQVRLGMLCKAADQCHAEPERPSVDYGDKPMVS